MRAIILLLAARVARAANRTTHRRLKNLEDIHDWVRQHKASRGLAEELNALRTEAQKLICDDDPKSNGACRAPKCKSPIDFETCRHQNNGIPCTPLAAGCKRPCAALSVKLYGAAGCTVREGVLMHLWGNSEGPEGGVGKYAPKDRAWRTSQLEGGSFADPRWADAARAYARQDAWFVAVLREPTQRVWSRYWYGGRFEGKQGAIIDELSYVKSSKCGNGGRGIGNRCLANYYVRTFASAFVECADNKGCNGGVPRAKYDEAYDLLSVFDDVLISEWLSHPGVLERLSARLCFVPTERKFKGSKNRDSMVSPSFLAKRAPGGKSESRPPDWAPPAEAAQLLKAQNKYDAELYAWAARRELARLKETRAAGRGLPVAGERWRDFERF